MANESLKPHQAVMCGLDSPAWNRYLSTLTPGERGRVVKAMRRIRVYEKHAMYWPKPSSYPKAPSL